MMRNGRNAIAMIELIFALVIMGIVLMSAPSLINVATKSGYVAIQQEAINEAATRMNIILGYPWDENNTDNNFTATLLRTTNGVLSLDPNLTTGRRAGTPAQSTRTLYRADGKSFFASSFIGMDANESIADDMDDFNGTTSLIEIEAAQDADYIEKSTVSIETTVNYVEDNLTNTVDTYIDPGADGTIRYDRFKSPQLPTTNIKHIRVRLTSTSDNDVLEKEIILDAFSCNIGAYRLDERFF